MAPLGSNYYTVQKGDSLWSIAKKFGITVDELKEANNLSGNLLNIGQNLFIPGKEEDIPSGDDIYYTVQKGDSLYSIAQKFKTTVDNLKALNNLATDVLSIGQVLVIPDESNVSTSTDQKTYTVKSGDTLYGIAQKHGISVDDLKSANNLTNNTLSIGQTLIIPDVEKESYIVQAGDTLYSIARKFDTSVSAIVEFNNLATNVLSIGQKLLIP